jgi:hypothetical protein
MPKDNGSAVTIGFESELWRVADEDKDVILGPIFLVLHHRSTSWNRTT